MSYSDRADVYCSLDLDFINAKSASMETSLNLSFGSLRTISLESIDYPVSSKLRFSLNGELVELDNPDPRKLLVHWLRESGHTGTKVIIITWQEKLYIELIFLSRITNYHPN